MSSNIALCQSAKELENDRKKLIKNIDLTNNYLNETRSNKSKTLDQYKLLSKQIENRESLMDNITKQLKISEIKITKKEKQLKEINTKQNELKADLGNIARSAYKRKLSSNIWTSLLFAKSFREAYIRMQYTKQFEEYSNRQLSLLKNQADSIKILVKDIDTELSKKKHLLSEENKNTKTLTAELSQKNITIKKLEKEEKKLLFDLKRQNKERLKLNELITLSINLDIESTPSNNESIELSSGFEHNKGRLPWPVKNGLISSPFGKTKHPTNKNVTIDNDGIDIRTEEGGIVKSIFDGQIASVNQIPGFYEVVIIKSGEYFIVYGRLNKVHVKAGEHVSRGTIIGELAIEENKSELQLQIWKGQSKLNPTQWLIRK